MSVKGDDTRSVNLLDLDYYSINEHITETDLYARIQNFSLGYLEPATLSILNSRINNSIASIPILPLVTSSDRIEDVGHRVYLTIQELLRAVDAQLFPLIVAINFDYHAWIHQCRSARITFKTEYDLLKQITDTPLDKPTTEVYDLRAVLQIHDFTAQLKSESYEPGPFSSSTPSVREQQIADAIEQATGARGVAVVIEAKHLCMMMRGVEKQNSVMTTSAMKGIFRKEINTRSEFLNLISR